MAEKRAPGFNKGDKESKGQFKKAMPVKPKVPTPSALPDEGPEILVRRRVEQKKQEVQFERAKKAKLNDAIEAYLVFREAQETQGEDESIKREEFLAFKGRDKSDEDFFMDIDTETKKRKLPFIRTNDLPETEFPKCIMLENYSGVHFWTTFENGNPLEARQKIEDFIYSSEAFPVAALYERITGEVEKDLKNGKSRTFIHLEF